MIGLASGADTRPIIEGAARVLARAASVFFAPCEWPRELCSIGPKNDGAIEGGRRKSNCPGGEIDESSSWRRASCDPLDLARRGARRTRLRATRARAGRHQARSCRRAGVALPEERRRVREAREREARRQGEGDRLRIEPAWRR